MSAVVRVKRRANEEPLSALVLNCKKPKFDESNGDNSTGTSNTQDNQTEINDEISTILKFAGTVQSNDAAVSHGLPKLTKGEAKLVANKIRNPNNILVKSRQDMQKNLHDNRFKIVNCQRAIDNETDELKEITIVDVEKETVENKINSEVNKTDVDEIVGTASTSGLETCNNVTQTDVDENDDNTNSGDYVYDLYVGEVSRRIAESDVDSYLSVRPFDDLIYEDHFNNDDEDAESEDSNDEGYFRNDYPDEEDDCNESIDDEDMIRAVQNFNIDQELSSDDENYVDVNDTEALGFQPDIDAPFIGSSQDAARYGIAYAKYKARIQNESDDDLEDDYYSD